MRYIVVLICFSAVSLYAMQSPVDADRERCLAQYQSSAAGIYDDRICMELADMGFPGILYLVGVSYMESGQKDKAAVYFQKVIDAGNDHKEDAEQQLIKIHQGK